MLQDFGSPPRVYAFRRAAAQTAKEREIVRNLGRFWTARPPHLARFFRLIHLLGLSARRLGPGEKFSWTDTANLSILKDVGSPSRVYAFHRAVTETTKKVYIMRKPFRRPAGRFWMSAPGLHVPPPPLSLRPGIIRSAEQSRRQDKCAEDRSGDEGRATYKFWKNWISVPGLHVPPSRRADS